MHYYIFDIRVVLACVMFWAAAACSPEDSAVLPDPDKPQAEGDWLSLSLHMPAAESRSDSHPEEPAVNQESDVDNLTLFIYTSNIDGLNAADTTSFHETRYITKDQFESDQTIGNERVITVKFQTVKYSLKWEDRIAVVANMGDLSSFTTLGQLQQHIPTRTWTSGAAIADYKDFTLASACNEYPDGFVISPTGTGEPGSEANPFSASMTIERTAARIDLDPAGASWNDKEQLLVYPATDKAGNTVGTVYISHVLPFNVMQLSSYALKRISAAATTDMSCIYSWTYTGTLPKDVSGKPVHYVVEPQTTAKASAKANAEAWFGNTRAALIAEQGKDYFADKPRFVKDKTRSYTILGYANENTAHTNHITADALTGIVIRALYVPAQLHTDIDLANPQTNVARGTDLWRYMPRNTSTEEAGVIYFATKEVAEAYCAAHPEEMATITKFEGGECYYHLWLKHTVMPKTDTPRPTFPMEYGIVRNHIYRVALTFSGIGREGTTVEAPHNVTMTIFVRPWRFFTHDPIIM